MELKTRAGKLLEDNYNLKFTQRVNKIYMENNWRPNGGNHLPLDVAIELAAVELGIIEVTAHED